MDKSKKKRIVAEIFDICNKKNNFVFDNTLVRDVSIKYGFKNQHDATKLDNSDMLPDVLKQNDLFILHIGKGKHQFVKGIRNGYHAFENIGRAEKVNRKYKRSILNEYDTSESNILSVVANQKIIHDFLYSGKHSEPNVYNARRTKAKLQFYVGAVRIKTESQQIELDQTLELNGCVTTIEGKNGTPTDFAVYQIYYPFLYYNNIKQKDKLKIKDITCCYLLRSKVQGRSVVKIYQYTFSEPTKMDSIKLLKAKQYNLIQSDV